MFKVSPLFFEGENLLGVDMRKKIGLVSLVIFSIMALGAELFMSDKNAHKQQSETVSKEVVNYNTTINITDNDDDDEDENQLASNEDFSDGKLQHE